MSVEGFSMPEALTKARVLSSAAVTSMARDGNLWRGRCGVLLLRVVGAVRRSSCRVERRR